jgi:type IV secretion system protein VirB8
LFFPVATGLRVACRALRCALATDQSAGTTGFSQRAHASHVAGPAMSGPPVLTEYFREAASWDADRTARSRRSAKVAWWVASAGWTSTVVTALALLVLMPLKRVDPFVVRVDNSTGIVDVVPIYAGKAPMDEAVTRYFLTHYLTVCERFNFATAESDYEECGAFHSAQRNQAWFALWTATNPASPLRLYKDGSSVRVQVEAVSFFTRGSGLQDLAQVRYVKALRTAGGTDDKFTHWVATVQYAYAEPATDPKIRRWNPLGFKIVEFKAEPEIIVDPSRAPEAPSHAH